MDVDTSIAKAEPPSNASRVTSALQERILLYSSLAQKQPESSGEHLVDIELELWDIEMALTRFRQQRNAFIPVARFPPEILLLIFHDLAELEPHYLQRTAQYEEVLSGDHVIVLGWIRVTQVCHAWREVAFADSRLWTAATSLLGKSWFKRQLRLGRYQPRQLDLILDGGLLSTYPQLTASPELLDTTSRLRIISRGSDLSDLADLKAPTVESLHVHVAFDEGRHSFPNRLFGGVTSRLRDLYVHNLSVSLDVPFLGSLTCLSLSAWNRGDSIPIAFERLASTLNMLGSLESLTLQHYSFDVSDEDMPMTEPMAMDIICPKLAHVNIYASGWYGTFLLMARLRPATRAQMTFATQYPDHSMGLIGVLILDIFRRRMINSDVSLIRGMQTVGWRARAPHSQGRDEPICDGPAAPCYATSVILSAWRENRPEYLLRDYEGYREHTPCPDFQLILGTRSGASLHLDNLIPFAAFPAVRSFSALPISRLSFRLSYDIGWRALFRVATSLEWLRADRVVGEDMLRGARNEGFIGQRPNPFPDTLRTLAMLGIRWDWAYDGEEGEGQTVCRMLNVVGAASNVHEVIVGPASKAGNVLRLEWTDATLSVVQRPDMLVDNDEEDWDELANF